MRTSILTIIPCPCEFAQPPTNNRCFGVLAYHIRDGHYGGLSLAGLNLILLGSFNGDLWVLAFVGGQTITALAAIELGLLHPLSNRFDGRLELAGPISGCYSERSSRSNQLF
jgi:Protein of unknown function (DUF1326)